MQKEMIFGSDWITVDLPDHTTLLPPSVNVSLPLKPVSDLAQAVQDTLLHPLDTKPLRELVRPGQRVTIAFDDPTVPSLAPVWETALPVIIEELHHAGVRDKDITLLCANALHRQFTHKELEKIIGEPITKTFSDRLLCHDAEDKDNISCIGKTKEGYDVELNRLATDSDLTIYLNAYSTGFNGGWKSLCVGLSTWRSIKWHHTPDVMSMSLGHNRLHEILDKMGKVVTDKLGRNKFFKVETLLANPVQAARIWAGSVDATRAAVLEVLKGRQKPRHELLEKKADIVCYGIPDWSPYAVFSLMNPLLTLVSTGLGYLGGMIQAVGRSGCSVIMATPCKDQWDEVHHPSYKEVWYRVLADLKNPYKIMDKYGNEFISRKEYIDAYRHNFGFHPVHGLLATQPLKRLNHAGRIFVAGAENPALVEHLGFEYKKTVEEAIASAQKTHGKDASIAFIQNPAAFNRQ